MRKLTFALLCSLLTAQVFGYDFKEEDSGLYFNITSNTEPYTVEVTYQSLGNDDNYQEVATATIPETVNYSGKTYSVTSIGSDAFYRCSFLVSVTIPNSVTSVGARAFYECSSLTSVIIPNSVTSIGSQAFFRCSGLTSVDIPNSVTSIGQSAFSGCNGLTSVTIPNSVMSISESAFYGCSGLTSVIIPNSVTKIGSNAFYSVNTIIYGGSATDEGSWSSNWGAGKRYYAVDENFAYSNTEKTIITEYLGQGTEVVIPNGVTEIGSSVFQNCTNLTSVSIPNSVTSIGSSAFYGCSNLTSVTIPNSVTGIGQFAFFGCNGLTSVTIPNSVMSISEFAFYGCSGLTSVDIPNSVTSIGSYAFYGCSGLTSVDIPNSVTSIGSYAFSGCNGLTSVTIPNSVTNIEPYAFRDCSGLTSVTIPNSVTSIGYEAFYGCSGLTSMTIPNSVTSIGSQAFYNCSGLTSMTIPNSVTSIGSQAFYNCSGLTSVTIPNSVTSIGSGTFYNCSGLTSVTIPNSVTRIDDNAFYNCTGLTSVVIGNSVAIMRNTFTGCSNITNITCNSLMPPVADSAFERSYEFYNKVTLTYPGEAYNLYSKMEPWCFFNVDTNAQGERVLYINRNDTVTYLDTVFVFNNDTIHSITHDTIVVVNQSITHDTTYVVSKDTVYVIGSTAKTYKVTSTTTNSVMGIGIGTGMYEENSQVELVAIANYGYHFTKWSDGNTNNPRFEKVTADCNYYAEFGVNNYSVMASSNNIKMGYVEGSDDYAYLSKTQLRAVPKYGYKFTGWSDGETVNPREVLVYCDTTFTALFMANDETDIDGETANGVVVYAHHNVIVVENATADIYVYDTMGRLVARKGVCEGSAQLAMSHEGIYIVKCGGDVKRIYLGFRN